jgi:hypothetical protein
MRRMPTEEQAIAESEEMDSRSTRTNERDDFDLSDYFQDDDTPDYKLSVKNSGPDEEEREIPLAGGTTFQDHHEVAALAIDCDERTETARREPDRQPGRGRLPAPRPARHRERPGLHPERDGQRGRTRKGAA